MAQKGVVYRYFRADADKDISGDVFEVSLDQVAWHAATYVAPNSWPTSIVAANTSKPVPAGKVGYWFQILTGPGTTMPLSDGTVLVYGRATDNPETPHFIWQVAIGPGE